MHIIVLYYAAVTSYVAFILACMYGWIKFKVHFALSMRMYILKINGPFS